MAFTRNRVLHAASPILYVYEAAGGQNFNSTPSKIEFDNLGYKTPDFTFTAGDDRIIIGKTGLYEIVIQASFETTANETIEVHICICHNDSATGGTRAQGTIVGTGAAADYFAALASHALIYLEKGDTIGINVTTDSATNIQNIANTSRLIIKYIDMKGWNNRNAGYDKYPFRADLRR